MRKTIWKFPISHHPLPTLIPEGGEILSAQDQSRTICVWALVDPEAALKPRDIRIFGTGSLLNVPERAKFIGTVQQGPFVWHVFEVPTNA